MKYEEEDIIDFCSECKEEILFKQGYVLKRGKFYHLKCYHLMIDAPLEDEDGEDFGDNRDQ
jgi:hypothetical protein